MEIKNSKLLNSNYNTIHLKKNYKKKYYIILFFKISFIIIMFLIYNIFLIKKNYLFILETIYNLKNRINKNDNKISNLKSNLENYKKNIINKNKTINQYIFTENIIFENEIKEQNNFCNNPKLMSNLEIDKNLKLTNAEFKNKKFYMYVYKREDFVSNKIIKSKNWELTLTNNIFKALYYFSKKNKIKENDIYIIDIGANIGWYTFTLSKFGYNIISFEPSKLNYYILKKNYCINKDLNIILINKGLYNDDKKCDIYYFKINKGDTIINCNNNITLNETIIKEGEIVLTKLDNYLQFIKGKNLLLIKIDVEGSEGKVFEGGVELITKYHVPFILMEFTPSLLRLQNSNPKKVLQMFENNGYKISPYNFLDKKNYTIEYIIKKAGYQINLYITYLKVFQS